MYGVFFLTTTIKPFRAFHEDDPSIPLGEMRVNFHQGQAKVWLLDGYPDTTVRIICLQCGKQYGKTCLGPHWIKREMDRMGPGDYGAVTATFPLLNEKMLPELQEVFVRRYEEFTYRAGDHMFESHEKIRGAPAYRIMVKSAHNPESWASGTWKAVWCDEVGQSQFPRQSWEEVNARVSINQGRIFCTTTVYEFGWYKYEIYDRWMDGDPSIAIVQGDSTDNPAFSVAEYERQRGLLPPWKFDMAFRGRFTNPAGLIYDSFNSDICLIPRFELPKEWPRYVGHDFGPNNTAAIWYASDPATGYLYAYREYYAGGLSNHDHAQKWKALSVGENVVNRVGGARAETGFREACTAAGWPIAEPKEFGVEAGINIVYGWHQHNKLFVFNDLDKYIAEKTTYSRELDANNVPTDKIENKSSFHGMDAERYVLSHMGPERALGYNEKAVVVDHSSTAVPALDGRPFLAPSIRAKFAARQTETAGVVHHG